MVMSYTGKIMVTPHAVEMYILRICHWLTPEEAEAELVEALWRPLFHCLSANGALMLWGCLNRAGYPILVATDPADVEAPFLLVRTVGPRYHWHEARQQWRAYNIGTKRRFRVGLDRLRSSDPIPGAV
jgi:hypothetical protein